MLSLRMIEDIKTIVKMPSVEGTFQQGAPFGKDIALTLDKGFRNCSIFRV